MENEDISLTTIYGSNLFSNSVLQERLPQKDFETIKKVQRGEEKLSRELSAKVAVAMKEWALEKGATHYSHWFHPMTGATAEKHDSFIEPTAEGNVLLDFSADSLLQGEPDASSFPSGGLRETFEARGYTAWDTTSPAFLRDDGAGKTLTIPTAFISYDGHSLDTKTPLLKSINALSVQARRVLMSLGMEDVKTVIPTVGPEQEYFLVDRKFYEKRPDLLLTGRTIFGSMPAKGQELDDHYFGAIKDRVKRFMKDLNEELWKLGISAKTQHNEVAPNQFELATVFSTANIATDNNQICMEIMQRVAERHDLVCLLHEKPFHGFNGSGKHNNWSLSTDGGVNLLTPGDDPGSNTRFLLFLVSIIKAVDLYAPLLRLSAANRGNDLRLGGHEAPPAVISVYLGDLLTEILEGLGCGEDVECQDQGYLKTGTSNLPRLPKDTSDRNRTSPFAFTGNKFEFRMVPSSGSIAEPNIVLNTAVADVLAEMAERLEQSTDTEKAARAMVKEYYNKHHRIIFNGDGYSDTWAEEARHRGLPCFQTTIDVLPELVKPYTRDLFRRRKVFTEQELESRLNVYLERYIKEVNIEAAVAVEMTERQIIPAALGYAGGIAESLNRSKTIIPDLDISEEQSLLSMIHADTRELIKLAAKLERERSELLGEENLHRQGEGFKEAVLPLLEELRTRADSLEKRLSKEAWPFPGYEDLLFRL